MLRTVLAVSVVLALLPAAAGAQGAMPAAVFPENNGRVLAGVRTFDAQFIISAWLNEPRGRDRVESNAQAAFELALRRDGVAVDASAPNYLFCEVSLANNGGLVFYHWSVQFYEFRADGLQQLQWTTGGVATVGERNFEDAEPARDCADAFANEWLKWNPKR
jgi:hypothetical protein